MPTTLSTNVGGASSPSSPNVGGASSPSSPNVGGASSPSSNLFLPYDPKTEAHRTRQHLPHWSQGQRTYFVTFRLADSLPQSKLREWGAEFESWRKAHPEPWDEAEWRTYTSFFQRKEEWLDAGYGSCLLRNTKARDIIETGVRHFDASRYILDEFVVMPNHVHVLCKPFFGHTLSEVLHSWKSFTASKINKACNRTGTLWQDESFDHIVRSWDQLEYYRQYIRDNPAGGSTQSGRGHTPLVCNVGGASSPS